MRAVSLTVLSTALVFCLAGNALGARSSSGATACAVAWNHGAASSLRARIVAAHPRGAFIDGAGATIGTVAWSKDGPVTQTRSQGCAIEFILARGDTLMVSGAWRNGKIPRWIGPVPSRRPVPALDNATVRPDGTVGFHG
jgi:hypothetical protein